MVALESRAVALAGQVGMDGEAMVAAQVEEVGAVEEKALALVAKAEEGAMALGLKEMEAMGASLVGVEVVAAQETARMEVAGLVAAATALVDTATVEAVVRALELMVEAMMELAVKVLAVTVAVGRGAVVLEEGRQEARAA